MLIRSTSLRRRLKRNWIVIFNLVGAVARNISYSHQFSGVSKSEGLFLREKFFPGQGWWSLPLFFPTHSNTLFLSTTPTVLPQIIWCLLENFFSVKNKYRWDMSLKSFCLTPWLRGWNFLFHLFLYLQAVGMAVAQNPKCHQR